jgi:D-arabinose 1-dehydrogenase-like Zn-dependent alcohol dehydrogenase
LTENLETAIAWSRTSLAAMVMKFLKLAPRVPIRTKVETFELDDANTALEKYRAGKLDGTAVLVNGS